MHADRQHTKNIRSLLHTQERRDPNAPETFKTLSEKKGGKEKHEGVIPNPTPTCPSQGYLTHKTLLSL